MGPVSPAERRALGWAGLAALLVSIGIALLVVPQGGWLRLAGVEGDTLASLRPFLTGIVTSAWAP